MKNLILITLIFLMIPGIMGCNNSNKVSGKKFQSIYETRNLNTMHYAEYLGHKGGKVYIVRKSISLTNGTKWNEEIIYTDISELDPSFKKQILANSTELGSVER